MTNEVKFIFTTMTWQLQRPWLPSSPNPQFAKLILKDMQFSNQNTAQEAYNWALQILHEHCLKCARWKGKPCRFTYSFSYHLNRIIFVSSFVLGNLHHRRGSPVNKKQQGNEHSNTRSVALRQRQCWLSLQSSIPHAMKTLSKQITESPAKTTVKHTKLHTDLPSSPSAML